MTNLRDDREQWTTFGGEGRGFAIGFSPSLFQAEREEPSPNACENLWMGRVIYGDYKTSRRHRSAFEKASEIASNIARNNEAAIRASGRYAYIREMANHAITSQMIWNCLTAKDPKLQREQETRAIMMAERASFDECRRYHDGRAYIEYQLPLSETGRVAEIFRPRTEPDAENRLRAFLREQGYPEDIPISRSSLV